MVTLTPAGVCLAFLEGQHAEDARTLARLQAQINEKATELASVAKRYEETKIRCRDVEAQMAQIMAERKTA